MREIRFTGRFKRDYKREKSGRHGKTLDAGLMTAYADSRLWQDVYQVPSPMGMLYVKFTADAITEFLLLSFKEKDND